jgi:hypothetical protein
MMKIISDSVMLGQVKFLSKNATHTMRKENQSEIGLLKGLGVEGDAHSREGPIFNFEQSKSFLF